MKKISASFAYLNVFAVDCVVLQRCDDGLSMETVKFSLDSSFCRFNCSTLRKETFFKHRLLEEISHAKVFFSRNVKHWPETTPFPSKFFFFWTQLVANKMKLFIYEKNIILFKSQLTHLFTQRSIHFNSFNWIYFVCVCQLVFLKNSFTKAIWLKCFFFDVLSIMT